MSIPFVKYLDTQLSAGDLTKITTKAEYKALESIRRHENGILAITENMLEGLREAIVNKKGTAQGLVFDMHLTRAYVAFNLRRYSARLEDSFSPRSWGMWLAEERSMGAPALGKAQQIIGIDLTQRPEPEELGTVKGQPKRATKAPKAEKPNPHAIRTERFEGLRREIQSKENAFRISKFTDNIEYDEDEFKITLYLRSNYVEIQIDEDHDENDYLAVEVNEEMFVEDFNSPVDALAHALDELEELAEEEEKELKKATPAVPTNPLARLLAALRATDSDDVENFGGFQHPKTNVVYILDEDKNRVLRITVMDGDTHPYKLERVGTTKDYGSFAKETGVLQKAWNVLEELWEEDDDEEEDEEEPVKVPARGRPASAMKKKRATDDEDDEDYPHIFSPFALARCPALMEFSKRREDLMRDADRDEDEVSSLYGVLRNIAEHNLTRILSTFWPTSFNFELVDSDEEEPVYILSVDPFSMKFSNNEITVVQNHACGSISFTHRVSGALTERHRLDVAMRYFDTWSSDRIRAMLYDTGFSFHADGDDVFRANDEEFSVVDRPDTPELFYDENNEHVDQLRSAEAYHQFSEYLSDCLGAVRGVKFDHNGEQHYSLVVSAGLQMNLVAVGSKTVAASHIRLVADTYASQAFFRNWNDGEFSLDTLRNKGMVVTEAPECVTLEFNYVNNGYLIHIYR